jgi:hypothetical protein
MIVIQKILEPFIGQSVKAYLLLLWLYVILFLE